MLKALLTIFGALLIVPSVAFGHWSSTPDSIHVVTQMARNHPVYYHFTDTTDSDWMFLARHSTFNICLDADTAGTAGSATVRIRKAISADSTNGSYIIDDVVLNGTPPLHCLFNVPGGRSIQVDVVLSPTAATAVVSVEAN